MSAIEEQGQPSDPDPVWNELEQVLAYHDGDALAAVQTLLEDCRHLRSQMSVTEAAMSAGFARGWRPNYER